MNISSVIDSKLRLINPQKLIHIALYVLLITTGIDKFFNVMVDWEMYLPPLIPFLTHIDALSFMKLIGIGEIVIALIVIFRPKIGGILAAFLFLGIAANIVLLGKFFNIAIIDVVIACVCISFANLSLQKEKAHK